MHVLLTGAAGFIGSRTAEFLLAEGHTVLAVDNWNEAYAVQLKYERLARVARSAGCGEAAGALAEAARSGADPAGEARDFAGEGFRFRYGDISDPAFVEELFAGDSFDAVVNLAARAGVRASMEDPLVYLDTNARGTLLLLEAMKKAGTRKLVLASTSSLYAGQSMPFTEDLPVNTPVSPYAATKKSAEVLAYTYHFLYGTDVSVLRYFTVYGPAGRPDMSLFRFTLWISEGRPLQLYGDGTQSRDFTYVDDIARGTVAALQPLGYEIINLGGGENPVSLNEVIHQLEELTGEKAEIEYRDSFRADVPSTWAKIEKAREQLGWQPETTLAEGLRACVDWYRENRDWVKDLPV